jgi:phosphoglycolate phosphatase
MRPELFGAAVIFDLDGTLVDTAADLAAAANQALAAQGFEPVPAARVRSLIGHGARATLSKAFAERGAAPSTEEMDGHLAAFLEYYHAHIADHSRPFPDAVGVIEELRRAGAKIAICTNKYEATSRLLIKKLGLEDLFDTIVGRDTAAAPKPDPAPVRLCLERAGVRRGVFIGDSDTDVMAAKAAGLASLIAAFGYGPLTLAKDAFAPFEDYRALPALIRRALEENS